MALGLTIIFPEPESLRFGPGGSLSKQLIL
ncbi:hypothetical protein FRAHR75_670021 [Frankia sp. Hr75.2]|nr:hypothetical protein FRAHR75_670021 [Frankia sp. Hr75.2]SQD94076.1 hypothetical protein FMEAI12_2240007 [Parafrankia sp. Ea1.12]